MGYDTIHLLPITRMGASLSPYATTNPFVIDASYDESEQAALKNFNRFVASLSKHGIRLCVDLVLNHLAIDHPLLQDHPDWTLPDATEKDGIKRAGWSDGEQWHSWKDLALLNYSANPGSSLWAYMLQYAMFWADFAGQTGGLIRLDNLHSAHPGFMEYTLQQIRHQHPQIQILAELFSDEKTIGKLNQCYGFSYLLATQWEHKFVGQLRQYFAYLHSEALELEYFVPVTSHDSGSVIEEFGDLRSMGPRMVMAALLSMGHWGILQGTEYALAYKLPFIGDSRPELFLPLHKRSLEKPPQYVKLSWKLNEILLAHPVLSKKGNIVFPQVSNRDDAVLCALRYEAQPTGGEASFAMLVFINFDFANLQTVVLQEASLLELGFSLANSYRDLLSGTIVEPVYSQGDGDTGSRALCLSLDGAQSLVLLAEEGF